MTGDRTEQDPWIGRCRSRWALPIAVGACAVALVVVVAGVAAGSALAWAPVLIALVVVVAVVPFVSILVTVDRRGLRVAYGPIGWPVTTVALAEIAAAHLEPDAVPRRWGGWGYRGSRRLVGRAAVVLRRGPAIRLELRSGATFLVTVDDADEGVERLRDLVAAAPS